MEIHISLYTLHPYNPQDHGDYKAWKQQHHPVAMMSKHYIV